MKRFQECSWYVKIWRYRWYLTIPYNALYLWIYNSNSFGFSDCWGIATGMSQMRMEWWYSMEECRQEWEDNGSSR